MKTSSVDNELLVLLSKSFFLWIQCPQISLLLFKDGADLRMYSFSCKQSLHTLSLGTNGFTFLTTSRLMLKLLFLLFSFQTCSLSGILLCSNLKDELWKLNLVLNSFSVSPIYVSWLFEAVSVTLALYTLHLVRHLPSIGQEFFFFADSYTVCYLDLILSFCAVEVSDGCYWRSLNIG